LQENDEAQEAVARYMLFFFNKSKPDRQQIIMEWLRYTKQKTRKDRAFLLLFISDDNNSHEDVIDSIGDEENGGGLEELKNHKVCKSAIASILDFGTTSC
jgi:spore maturation protein CgeB